MNIKPNLLLLIYNTLIYSDRYHSEGCYSHNILSSVLSEDFQE